MFVKVLLGVFITGENVESVAVDLDITANREVSSSQEGVVVVHVLVLAAMKELAFDNARILLGRLIHTNRVVSQVEGDNETAGNVFWDACVELSREAEDLLVIVHSFEEVSLGSLRHKLVHLTEGVALVTETVIGWLWSGHGLGRLRELDLAEREIVTVFLHVVLLGEGIDSLNHISDTVGDDIACGRDLVSGQVVVTNEALAWLVDIETVGELLTTEKEGEGISTIIGAVALTDFKCVISEIVVNHVIQVICCGEEAQHAAIIVQELLLGLNLATTEALLHEVSHFGVSLGRHGPLRHLEVVIGRFRRRRQLSSLALHDKAFEIHIMMMKNGYRYTNLPHRIDECTDHSRRCGFVFRKCLCHIRSRSHLAYKRYRRA